jgi:hypothetical protein
LLRDDIVHDRLQHIEVEEDLQPGVHVRLADGREARL